MMMVTLILTIYDFSYQICNFMLRSLFMLPCDAFYGTKPPVKFEAFVRLLLGSAFTRDWDKVIDLY